MNKIGEFLAGVFLSVLLGAAGGALIAGRAFAAVGAVFGALFSIPVAVICSALTIKFRGSIVIVAICQFAGAMIIGFTALETIRNEATLHWVLLGQFLGGITYLGIKKYSRKRQTGLCPKCLYDLTGNTSGVCPECGTPIPEKQQMQLRETAPH